MEDEKIIEMFRNRDETAVVFANQKYGSRCYGIAMEYLHSEKEAEKCVNEVWIRLWQEFPQEMTGSFQSYLERLTQSVAAKACLGKELFQNSEASSGQASRQNSAGRHQKREEISEPEGFFHRGWKYLPVAACLAILFSYCYLFLNAFLRIDDEFYQFQLSMQNISLTNAIAAEDMQEDDGASAFGVKSGFEVPEVRLPVRQDYYEGPVFAMTATGDNQDLQTIRKLRCEIQNQYVEETVSVQPILNVQDSYEIWNLSSEDKTVQLVYPFVTTLNCAYEMEEPLIQMSTESGDGEPEAVESEDGRKDGVEADIKYCAGKSISAFRHRSPQKDSALKDYEMLLSDESNTYMEQALRNRDMEYEEMNIYLFQNFTVDASQGNKTPVLGITVAGAEREFYTYGFDYEERVEEDAVRCSFFVPETQDGHFMLITPRDTKIDIGYYTNLNWEEKVSGVSCQVLKQQLGKYYALKVCARWMLQQLKKDYENGLYAAALPEYLDDEMLVGLAADLSDEGELYQVFRRRYQTTELTDVFSSILQEARIVFALFMVTVPVGQPVQITANTQKRQMLGNYEVSSDKVMDAASAYVYDFFVRIGNRINIQKATLQCLLPKEWKLADSEEGWQEKQKEETVVWKRRLVENSYQIEILR